MWFLQPVVGPHNRAAENDGPYCGPRFHRVTGGQKPSSNLGPSFPCSDPRRYLPDSVPVGSVHGRRQDTRLFPKLKFPSLGQMEGIVSMRLWPHSIDLSPAARQAGIGRGGPSRPGRAPSCRPAQLEHRVEGVADLNGADFFCRHAKEDPRNRGRIALPETQPS